MENQFYQMYLDELSEIPECTNEEMEALLNSLPNEEAVKRLTEGSLAYVVREAAKYAGNDVEISDLVQEGNMALLLVLKNYASHPVVGDDAVSYFNQLRERAVHMAMEAVTEEQKQSEQTAEKLTASVNVLNVVMTKLAEELGIGEITLRDIVKELEKPARDPRDEMPKPILRTDVLEMKDLKEGMVLKGTVRNVIDFGVFVDIGVHQDGLVHISQITDRYIKHPLEAVSVGDVVDVKVMSVDLKKKRIQLTMRGI